MQMYASGRPVIKRTYQHLTEIQLQSYFDGNVWFLAGRKKIALTKRRFFFFFFHPDYMNIKFCRLTAFFNGTSIDSVMTKAKIAFDIRNEKIVTIFGKGKMEMGKATFNVFQLKMI